MKCASQNEKGQRVETTLADLAFARGDHHRRHPYDERHSRNHRRFRQ